MRIVAAALLFSSVFSSLFPAAMSASTVPASRYRHLARGVNLTRWFQYGSHQVIGEADRDLLKTAGFTAVRIAVAPQYLLSKWAPAAEVTANLEKLDRGIELFIGSGMAVTLDFQADAEYLDDYLATPGSAGELIETWRMLASRYSNRDPELLFFEVMNEPDSRFTQAAWDQVQKEVLRVIHECAPAHTVLLAPANWSGLDALLRMTPYPNEPNVLYVLHYYSPATFTHQGATWTDQPGIAALRGVPWPAWLTSSLPSQTASDPDAADRLAKYRAEDWDREQVEWDMSLVARWQRKWNAKVIVNEFGAYKPFAGPDSRARWLHDVRGAIEKNGLAWAVWDYAAGFDVVETQDGTTQDGTTPEGTTQDGTTQDGTTQDGKTRIDPLVSAALGLTPWRVAEPARAARPPFSGPRTVQIGPQPDDHSGAAFLTASGNLVLLTPSTPGRVRLYINRGGILEPRALGGLAPVPGGVWVIPLKSGFFLAGDHPRLLLRGGDALRDSGTAFPRAGSAASMNEDLILFGDRPELWHGDGRGVFHPVPEAFPGQTEPFSCGVVTGGTLYAFGKGSGAVFRSEGSHRFVPQSLLPPNSGDGRCTAITGVQGEVIVAWANGEVQIVGKGRIGPLPPPKQAIRNIAMAGNLLVISRAGEPPLLYSRRPDGEFVPVDLEPANNLPVVVPIDLNGDGLTDLVYAQGGNAPLVARFGRR